MVLLKTFTAGFKLGWILVLYWFVNVPMIVLAILKKGDTCVNRRVVMLKAFIGIFRNPKDITNYYFQALTPNPQSPISSQLELVPRGLGLTLKCWRPPSTHPPP